MEEGEIRNEAWVKIVGLPISLWGLTILRRVGKECGGFLAIDPQTEKLEELQWARILVTTNREKLPSVLEIRLSLRKAPVDSRETIGRTRGEVRGDDTSHVGPRVVEEMGIAWLKALHLSTDGMCGQVSGSGREVIANRVQVGSMARPSLNLMAIRPPSSSPSMGSKGSKLAWRLIRKVHQRA